MYSQIKNTYLNNKEINQVCKGFFLALRGVYSSRLCHIFMEFLYVFVKYLYVSTHMIFLNIPHSPLNSKTSDCENKIMMYKTRLMLT